MTEITFVGDVHSNFSQFVKLTKKKKKTQAFFQAGDFGLFSSIDKANDDYDWHSDYRPNMKAFIELYENDKIKKFDVPVYFIKGIHDDYDIDEGYLKHKNMFFIKEGTVISVDDINIACLGGIYSKLKITRKPKRLYGKDRRFFTNDEIEALQQEAEKSKIDVLFTCQAATGCLPIRHNVKQEEGSRELRRLLDSIKPRYYIHGHHHHNYVRHENEDPTVVGLGNFGKNKKSFFTLTL